MKNKLIYKGDLKKDTFGRNVQYLNFDLGFNNVDWMSVSRPSEVTLKEGLGVESFIDIVKYSLLTPINHLQNLSLESIALKEDLSGAYIVANKMIDKSALSADFKSNIFNMFLKKTFKETDLNDIMDPKCYEMLMNKKEKKGILSKVKETLFTKNTSDDVLNIFREYLLVKDNTDVRFFNQKFIKNENIKKITEILTLEENALPIFEISSSNRGFTTKNKKSERLVERLRECFPSPTFFLNENAKIDILLKLSKSSSFSDNMLLSTLNVLSANGNYGDVAFDFYKLSRKDEKSKKIVASLFILDDNFSPSYMAGILACGAVPEFLKMAKTYEDLVRRCGSEKAVSAISLSEGKTFKNRDTLLYLSTFINGFSPYNAAKVALNELAGENAYWNKSVVENKKVGTVSIDVEKLNLSFLNYDYEVIKEFPNESSYKLSVNSFFSFIQGALSDLCDLKMDGNRVKIDSASVQNKDGEPTLCINRNVQFIIGEDFIDNPSLVRALEMSMNALEGDFIKNIQNKITDEQMRQKAALVLDFAMSKILVQDTMATIETMETPQDFGKDVINRETTEFKI